LKNKSKVKTFFCLALVCLTLLLSYSNCGRTGLSTISTYQGKILVSQISAAPPRLGSPGCSVQNSDTHQLKNCPSGIGQASRTREAECLNNILTADPANWDDVPWNYSQCGCPVSGMTIDPTTGNCICPDGAVFDNVSNTCKKSTATTAAATMAVASCSHVATLRIFCAANLENNHNCVFTFPAAVRLNLPLNTSYSDLRLNSATLVNWVNQGWTTVPNDSLSAAVTLTGDSNSNSTTLVVTNSKIAVNVDIDLYGGPGCAVQNDNRVVQWSTSAVRPGCFATVSNQIQIVPVNTQLPTSDVCEQWVPDTSCGSSCCPDVLKQTPNIATCIVGNSSSTIWPDGWIPNTCPAKGTQHTCTQPTPTQPSPTQPPPTQPPPTQAPQITTGTFCFNGDQITWKCGLGASPGDGWVPKPNSCYHHNDGPLSSCTGTFCYNRHQITWKCGFATSPGTEWVPKPNSCYHHDDGFSADCETDLMQNNR
jgi:hypothetical protein